MQKPTLWLLTATCLPELSSLYWANCSKCQWLWPFFESNPMVPARTRPMMCPFCQKYWNAFMIGEPWDRKPSTSSGAWPTDTVAPKSSWSDAACVLVFFTWTTEIPQEGSGTRSGNVLAGGLARAGTAGADFRGRLFGWPGGRFAAWAPRPPPADALMTVIFTVAAASAAAT